MSLVKSKTEFILKSRHGGRSFSVDVTFLRNGSPKPVIIFIHGFKGFKDWGYYNLLADFFAQKSYVFIKLNLSHNGTTPERPTEFVDLEAFGHNNFSIELDDIGVLIDHLFHSSPIPENEVDLEQLYLIGHSRGGSMAILKAAEDDRVKAIAAWAAVSNLEKRWSLTTMRRWQEEGVQWIYNARTKQNMPVYYQLWEDVVTNKARLNIPEAISKLTIPVLVAHGTDDETLPISMAYELKLQKPDIELLIVGGADHAFGGKHPYTSKDLPKYAKQIAEATFNFLRKVKYLST